MTIVMTTPYLDEAERCNRVTMMSAGNNLVTGTPAELKRVMKGEVVELVCADVRGSFARVRAMPLVKEAQAFGDRMNILVGNAGRDVPPLLGTMKTEHIDVESWRVVPPSLENVFISLMTEQAAKEGPSGLNSDPGSGATAGPDIQGGVRA
jgi:ABC-2 type transport system ATP-binding protein